MFPCSKKSCFCMSSTLQKKPFPRRLRSHGACRSLSMCSPHPGTDLAENHPKKCRGWGCVLRLARAAHSIAPSAFFQHPVTQGFALTRRLMRSRCLCTPTLLIWHRVASWRSTGSFTLKPTDGAAVLSQHACSGIFTELSRPKAAR